MRLTTVLSAVNENPSYYMFIPKQVLFWGKFNIKFVAIFIGEAIPDELEEYSDNIILWSKNLDLNHVFVAQNMRIYYPALLDLPDDEVVMITDMDMLPMNDRYYKEDLDSYGVDDFIYYRHIEGNEIYVCYNAAHPKTWGKVFGIESEKDIEDALYRNYVADCDGVPGSTGWFFDQLTLFEKLTVYPKLKVLERPIKRLETWDYEEHLENGDTHFIGGYDDAHFHRSFFKNIKLIRDAESQLGEKA